MIANINKSSKLLNVLIYNQKKVDKGSAKILFVNNMIEPKNGIYSVGLCQRSFEPFLIANQKTEYPIYHISLNPHPKDILTDEQYEQIARDYMNQLGYGEQPYIVYKHEDIERHHLHIVTTCVQSNGKRIPDHYEKLRSKKITDELEMKFNLHNKQSDPDVQTFNDFRLDTKGDIKKQIQRITLYVVKNYKFSTMAQYRALLEGYGITVDEVNGNANGKDYRGLVYTPINRRGKKTGHPIKSSKTHAFVGADCLQKKFKKDRISLKKLDTSDLQQTIFKAITDSKGSIKKFKKILSQQNISLIVRVNAEKRIYGITFIDHASKCVFNGSQLSRELSANAIEKIFNPKTNETPSSFNGKTSSFDDQIIFGNLFPLFSISSNGADAEEEAFINEMSKKRKKKKKKNTNQ